MPLIGPGRLSVDRGGGIVEEQACFELDDRPLVSMILPLQAVMSCYSKIELPLTDLVQGDR